MGMSVPALSFSSAQMRLDASICLKFPIQAFLVADWRALIKFGKLMAISIATRAITNISSMSESPVTVPLCISRKAEHVLCRYGA